MSSHCVRTDSLENSDGYTRHNYSAIVSRRELAETFLPPFEACVAAAPEQVMCSYNAVNGTPACLDAHAQTGWLRGQQGFDGVVVSDCGAIDDAWRNHRYSANASQAAAQGIRAGCDFNCGTAYGPDNLKAAMADGALPSSLPHSAEPSLLALSRSLGMLLDSRWRAQACWRRRTSTPRCEG